MIQPKYNTALSFDDVLLVPKFSSGESRSIVNLKTNIFGYQMLPIIAANMESIVNGKMIQALEKEGVPGIMHRFCSPEEQWNEVKTSYLPMVSIEGDITKAFPRVDFLYKKGLRHFVIDVAHANNVITLDCYHRIKTSFVGTHITVGNFATTPNDKFLTRTNTSFKFGIGSGSMCSTRIVTGCGLPTLETIRRVVATDELTDQGIIADGGFKNSGDIVKALAMGADAIMIGSLLACAEESASESIQKNGMWYKSYYGSASRVQSGKTNHIEGESTLVEIKGTVQDIVKDLLDGIRSGMTYCGAYDLKTLRQNAEFVQITTNGYRESTPHGKND